MDIYQTRLRDHINGHIDKIYSRLDEGEDLSKFYPNETRVYKEYKSKGESFRASTGFSTNRVND